jgi:predicted RNA-binding Zn ribbon-like protein
MTTPTPGTDVHHEPTAEPECDPALFVEFANRLPIAPFGVLPADVDAEAAALRAWLAEHGLLKGGVARAALRRELPAFRKFRTVIRAVATRLSNGESPTRAQVGAINAAMRDGLHYHALRPADAGQRFRLEQVGDELHHARATVAASLAHYLADHDHDRLRVCADDTCGWLFVDQSPAGRRRWCDMRTCGNRAKVAAHRARLRAESAGAGGPVA